jgi:hypothetical protein
VFREKILKIFFNNAKTLGKKIFFVENFCEVDKNFLSTKIFFSILIKNFRKKTF